MNNSIASIIIAAGYSSRMGSFKPLLKFGHKSAIEILIETYKSSGVNNIIIVTGFNGREVTAKLNESGSVCLQNDNYKEGMFSSVIKGIKGLDSSVSAFFMQPVDIPLVKKHTIEALINKYQEMNKGIIYPNFCGRTGHPPLIDCKYRKAILGHNGEGGLKRILQEYSFDSISIPVFDKAVLMDMDNVEDFKKMLMYFKADAPDLDECRSILKIYKVPEKIIRHCWKVTEASVEILQSLGNLGCDLNESALKAAAMLHDIAKNENNHARAGEKILNESGFRKVGSIIGSHTDIEVDEEGRITESEILYLADKIVKEDKIISIAERFEQPLNKYKNNPEVFSIIKNRREAAYKIVKKIEALTGSRFVYQ